MSTGSKNGEYHTQKSNTTIGRRETRLDLRSLDNAVEQYFSAGIAPSTKRVYDSGKKRYLAFCKQLTTTPIPASENLLCKFISYLALNKVSSATIKVYLAAVRQLHISQGLPAPPTGEMAKLSQVL